MNELLVAAGVAAVAIAAACAAADGALLSGEGGPTEHSARGDASAQPGDAPTAERTHRALAAARLLALLSAGSLLSAGLGLAALSRPARWSVAFAITVLVVATAEVAARAAGDELGMRALGRLRPLVRVVGVVLSPIVALGAGLDAAFRRAFPPPDRDAEGREVTAEQFREVVAAEADVSPRDEALLKGVFSLGDTSAEEVMVPRVAIVGIERETPWSDVVARARSSEHSRFPVYAATLDEIVGVLYAKDLLPAVVADVEPAPGWQTLVRPAEFIPATKTIDVQLRDFQSSGTHIAIVVDEFGGTAGLITIENILEEIVGDIRDEYDDDEARVRSEAGVRFWVPGRLTLDDLSTLLGEDHESDEVTTVGGLIYEKLGRVPRPGERLTIGGYRVVVERVVRRKVERVYFERMAAAVAPAGDE